MEWLGILEAESDCYACKRQGILVDFLGVPIESLAIPVECLSILMECLGIRKECLMSLKLIYF